MKAVRTIVAWTALAVLGGGYFASQVALLRGAGSDFAYRMDQAPIRILAAAVLAAAIGCAVFRGRD